MPDLLLELFSEEIPARMQPKASDDLKRLVTDGLVARGLTYAHAAAFATPRRLTLAVEGLADASLPVREERKGPRADASEVAIAGFLKNVGISHPNATAILEDLGDRGGSATFDDVAIEVRDDRKARAFFAVTTRPGRPAAEIVAETVEAVVRDFPWPKSMRWGGGSLRWVRPLQSILCILTTETGTETVPFAIDGIASGNTTRGHRFHAPEPFAVTSFDDYGAKLARAHVILDAAERAARIFHDATQAAFARGLSLVDDPALLAENAGLTEWPVTLLGDIDPRFLDLPPEVLQTSMRTNQKFFSLKDATGRITAYALVANRDTADDGATIRAGNARVLAARLADAEFFWQNDLRTSLDAMAAKLATVTFHNKLGTQGDRIARIAALARELAPAVGADPDLAERAAKLAKADLASQMVYEFPELQGTMGRAYALHAGDDAAVAAAGEEHYAPLGPSDAVPTAPLSVAVALADKLDTLTGFWAIDEKPTGSKDPFALRRASLGIVRTVIENSINLSLRPTIERSVERHLKSLLNGDLFDKALTANLIASVVLRDDMAKIYADATALIEESLYLKNLVNLEFVYPSEQQRPEVLDRLDAISTVFFLANEEGVLIVENFDAIDWSQEYASQFRSAAGALLSAIRAIAGNLIGFLADRLKVHLRGEGVRHDVIDACFQLGGQDDLVLLVARVRALQDFLATDDGANLLAGYKRATSILTQEERKDGVEYSLHPDPRFAETDAERALFAALDAAEAALGPALEAEDFAGAMTALARLRAPIDAFFDTTTVNADSPAVRRNRLCLLNRIRAVMNRVAVFSAIEGG